MTQSPDQGQTLTPQEEENLLAVFRERPGIARDVIDASVIVPNVRRQLEEQDLRRKAGSAPGQAPSVDEWDRLDHLADLFRLAGWLVFFWPDLGPYLALLSERARGAGEHHRMDGEFITAARPDKMEKESAFARRRLELFFDAITESIEWKSEVVLTGTATVRGAPLPDWCDPKDVGRIGEVEPRFIIKVTEREKRLFDILKPYHAHMLPVEGAFLAGSLGIDFGRPGWLRALVARLGRHAFMSPSLWLQIQNLVDEAQGQHVSPDDSGSREQVKRAKAELAGLFEELARRYRLPKVRTVDRASLARKHDEIPKSEQPSWRKNEAKQRKVRPETILRYVKQGRVILKRQQKNHR